MSRIILCETKEAKKPYVFSLTNVEISSIEEFCYYCYHNYERLIIEDFPKSDFLNWLKDEIGFSEVDNIINQKDNVSSTKKLYQIIKSVDYFSKEELSELNNRFSEWDNLSQREKLEKRGDLSLQHYKYKEALSYYKKAVALEPSPKIYHDLGVIYMNFFQFEVAVDYFTASLEIDENIKTIRQYLYALLYSKQYDILKEKLHNYINDYDDSHIWFIIGEYYEYMNDDEKALTAYYRVNDLDKDFLEIYERILIIYKRMNQIQSALELIETIKTSNPLGYAFNMSIYYEMIGDLNEAIECLEQVVTNEINNPDIFIRLSSLYEKQNSMIKAIDAIHKACEIDKYNPLIEFKMALLNKQVGHIDDYNLTVDRLINEWKENYRLATS
ncbi:MAG: tetratricopeptide repeat protein [bacterium]